MKLKTCLVCRESYRTTLEIHEIESTGHCTLCAEARGEPTTELVPRPKRLRCRICHEYYDEIAEIRRIERTRTCTACASAHPLYPLRNGSGQPPRRESLPRLLARQFRLPKTRIEALLEDCTPEEAFEVLSGMESNGTLAAERRRCRAERRVRRRKRSRFIPPVALSGGLALTARPA